MIKGNPRIVEAYINPRNPLDLSNISEKTPWWSIKEQLSNAGISRDWLDDAFDSLVDESTPGIPKLLDPLWSQDAEGLVGKINEAGYDVIKITEDNKPAWVTFESERSHALQKPPPVSPTAVPEPPVRRVPMLTEEQTTTGLKEAVDLEAVTPVDTFVAENARVTTEPRIIVYHGTRKPWAEEPDAPYGKFHIHGYALTGEGGQAFGAGAYVAEERKVAETYPPKRSILVDGKNIKEPSDPFDPSYRAAMDVLTKGYEEAYRQQRDRIRTFLAVPPVSEHAMRLELDYLGEIEKLEGKKVEAAPATVYTLQIKGPKDLYAEYDEDIDRQPLPVRQRLAPLINEFMAEHPLPEEEPPQGWERVPLSWMEFYMWLKEKEGSLPAASKKLSSLGVKGVRFLDQLSRGPGAKSETYNYVIFDSKDIITVAKDGKRVPLSQIEREKGLSEFIVPAGETPFDVAVQKEKERKPPEPVTTESPAPESVAAPPVTPVEQPAPEPSAAPAVSTPTPTPPSPTPPTTSTPTPSPTPSVSPPTPSISPTTPPVQPYNPGPQALGIHPIVGATARRVAAMAHSIWRDTLMEFVDVYCMPMIEQLARNGGVVCQQVARELNQIVTNGKAFYGRLTPILDRAKRAVGSITSIPEHRWLYRLGEKPTPYTGIANVVGAIENTLAVPRWIRPVVDIVRRANYAIGQLATLAHPGFVPHNLFQRMVTAFGYDVVRAGRGETWNRWTEGLAVANNRLVVDVRRQFRRWKDELDHIGGDPAGLHRINQDFTRDYPKTITHVKTSLGWEEVIHTNLFNYLETAAQRTAMAAAFRQVYTPGSGLFASTRRAVMRELQTNRDKHLFDQVMRAIQGLPTDNLFDIPGFRPGTFLGQVARLSRQLVFDVAARAVLTGQMAVQLGEVLSGATPMFFGYPNMIRALRLARHLYNAMEIRGLVNRAMLDFTWDVNARARSAAKIAGNAISKLFAEQLWNELQESLAAATAVVVAGRIRAGRLDAWERRNLPRTFREMGFSPAEAARLMAGDQALLDQFTAKAASWLTAGNRQIVEGSLLGGNRLFNSIFRFQLYPMMRLNQVRKVTSNFAHAIESRPMPEKIAAARQWLRMFGFMSQQGAITAGALAMAYGGPLAAMILLNEAMDNPAGFVIDSFMTTLAGPFYMMSKGFEDAGFHGVARQFLNAVWPISMGGEIFDMANGSGPYKYSTDRFSDFVRRRIPGSRPLRVALATLHLSKDNPDLDTAKKAFYRWRKNVYGFKEEIDYTKSEEKKKFIAGMRHAVKSMGEGDWEGFGDGISRALNVPGKDIKSIGASLRARTVLKTPDGKELGPEELDTLRKHIGIRAVEILQNHDMMIETLSKIFK
jgi:hypothetical protein